MYNSPCTSSIEPTEGFELERRTRASAKPKAEKNERAHHIPHSGKANTLDSPCPSQFLGRTTQLRQTVDASANNLRE